MIPLLLIHSAFAGTLSLDLSADRGPISGGTLADDALVLADEEARLDLAALASAEGTLRLVVEEGSFALGLGEASWTADYRAGGGITLGEGSLPFPHGHRLWQMREDPVIELGADYWETGGMLHADLLLYEGAWWLFWSGIMSPGYGYRQVGLATSTDTVSWTRHAENPVITIDYGAGYDGVHNHMPTVTVDDDGGLQMHLACYQNNVGNRICGASSEDGLSWTKQGVMLDLGESGDFDEDSLRCPEVIRTEDGTWHMLYYGTVGDEHYGPTGYATSADGLSWTKHGAFTDKAGRLECPGLVQTPYGVEGWHNCADALCYIRSDGDMTVWEMETTPDIVKDWAPWNSGYVQGPSIVLDGNTYRMVFNAYSYDTGLERLAWAETEPAPGAELELRFSWDGEQLRVSMDDGPALETGLMEAEGLVFGAEGRVRLLSLDLSWEEASSGDGGGTDGGGTDGGGTDGGATDGGGSDGGGTDGGGTDGGGTDGGTSDGGASDGGDADDDTKGGCSCATGAPASLLALLPVLALLGRRRGR